MQASSQGRMQLTDEARAALEPSCLKCPHFRVCVIFRAVQGMMSAEFPLTEGGKQTTPFSPTDLAKICNFYVPPGAGELTA